MVVNANSTRVVTGKVRFSFCNLFEPRAIQEDQAPKYSVMLLIPKSDTGTITRIKNAIDSAAKKGMSTKFGGKMPPVLNTTFKDADKDTNQDGEVFAEKWPETKKHYIINVTSKSKPGVVDKDCNPIIDPMEVYSGCYGRASINFFAYNNAGKKGVSAALNNVQKLEDGEPLGSIATPEQDFSDDLPY